MNTSELVKQLCKEQKITIAELARRIGQSRQNLYKKLQRETLSIDEIKQIADALGVEAKILLGAVNDEVYLREEVKTQLKTAVEKILENPSYTLGHVDYRRKE